MSDRDTALTSTTALKATSDKSVDPWLLVRRGRESADSAQDESLFALANGSLGVRGGIEEAGSPTHGCFLAGVWERTEIEYHERFSGFAKSTDTRVPVADGTRIQLSLGETAVSLKQGEWLDFSRMLDLRHGCLRRSLRWRAPSGVTLDIQAERIVALDTPGLLAIRYRVRSIDYTALSLLNRPSTPPAMPWSRAPIPASARASAVACRPAMLSPKKTLPGSVSRRPTVAFAWSVDSGTR